MPDDLPKNVPVARRLLTRGQRVELSIEKMAVGGRGVARFEGAVIFVALAAPGDRVLAEIVVAKKNYAEAEIIEVLAPGPSRVEPPCPYVGRCGGCSWQQIGYDEQLRQKRLLVEESLRKHSGFLEGGAALAVLPTVASPQPFRYRNRIQLHRAGPKGGAIGFRARREARIVDVEDCLIADLPLAEALTRARADIAAGRYRPPQRFELQLMPNGSVRREADANPAADDADGPGFAQVNAGQNERLVARVIERFRELAGPESLDAIWDLYAGAGNFTFPLADAFPAATIDAVELHAGAAAAGRARAQDEGLGPKRVRFHAERSEDWLARASVANGRTAALLDPPRVGCDPRAMQALAAAPLRFLVYVSCHPVTLARDLRPFHEAGWRLDSVEPFDMFPQTDHVETVVCLRPPTSG